MKAYLAVLERHQYDLLKIPGVVSVGVGYKSAGGRRSDQMSIVVGVIKKLPAGDIPGGQLIPPHIEGIPTDVVEVGRLRLT